MSVFLSFDDVCSGAMQTSVTMLLIKVAGPVLMVHVIVDPI